MKAGFSKVKITPPLGTHLYGFGNRDVEKGCDAIHDDLFVRAVYLSHEGEEALILGFDLLFFSRAQCDQFKGALGRELNLRPRQILINTSHTHAGPMIGAVWAYATFVHPDPVYPQMVEEALMQAAREARTRSVEVRMSAGAATTKLPVSRRLLDDQGIAQWQPNPKGTICNHLPLCLLSDTRGKPVCLLFSVSCHPSSINGFQVSADYPGLAMDLIDQHLGAECSLFLQGAGGDTKSLYTAKPDGSGFQGSWDAVRKSGELVGEEVISALKGNRLKPVEPRIRSNILDLSFPLQKHPSREHLEKVAGTVTWAKWLPQWATVQLKKLDSGLGLPGHWPALLHGLELSPSLRLVAIEAEVVAELGLLMMNYYKDGLTFPLGYSNGMAAYLPTSRMIASEGGYEVDSFTEYGLPSLFAVGIEQVLTAGLQKLL